MKPKFVMKYNKILKSSIIIAIIGVCLSMFFTADVFGATAKEINASVNAALDRFYKHTAEGKKIVNNAKGVLVLPSVKKGAFIVGGQYGEGALRIGGKTAAYYNMMAGSIGLQFGGEAMDIIIAFNSTDALKKFRASKGWEAGVDGNIAVITLGGGERAMTEQAKEPITAFVYDVKGLMIDMSLRGAKFNKLEK